MPAYRSDAEKEVRDAVVSHLRKIRPNARIIHEINTCQGGNRIDVLAVDIAEIIAVEVKSKKDKLDRLPKQIIGMRGSAHHVVSAIHEKFLVQQVTNEWAAHSEKDGEFYRGNEPDEANGSNVWVYPERDRTMGGNKYDGKWHCFDNSWDSKLQVPLPYDAIHMLWRAELLNLCERVSHVKHKKATMAQMINSLRWYIPAGELTKGICAELRARDSLEADPPIKKG